ncbi:MAG: ribosome biogenesis GTPase YlqF [Candidatus Phytoplasma stylosanthis]|uniref:ribosome biogenesis GTPase YlqF n=1 Tax=Candidatus Phytoplasma stylosanthis TaxID=2798314 RepID=UPI00293AA0A1|nr:ribosome biogenesis GTPase YlqF [Candidatus Phytoplasma stylosanthis]MDV3167924.1 ribosome biogenesis GTPase YlqF [Candidatus Phytoplasma stylosanthis]MDV3170759.1 ribosome biogenesis GTPase YlqF [Candidatus Phytoplasma stylosanthis]MDV3173726.1 ribosome biogenesis GTPase YlqF [Candidatus Phytoplasma stylosanthis]MDV3174016.1 ribosome biogenesis GTPase YlqF [Candidatus Phytoplasma stylosanthis]MDV3202572.1 ribosome biogenesis GTPase YlqF [Candidatus Phytoplasma stylosanthis]
MTIIQWFPGHMKKTLQDISKNLKLVDCVLIILDARIPFSSMNFSFLKLLNNKPFLVLFNKSYLADLQQNSFFINHFHKKKIHTLNIDSKNIFNIHKIYPKVKEMLKINNVKLKKILKLMVIGAPNVGKSTLINVLSNKKVTKTANLPGITKKIQWINLQKNVMLLDTPGCLCNKFECPEIGYSLAVCGCLKESVFSKEKFIIHHLNYLKKYYPLYLQKIFHLTDLELQKDNLFQIVAEKIRIYNHFHVQMENDLLSFIFKKIKNNFIYKINYDLDLKYLF